jgi:hypothetical protein
LDAFWSAAAIHFTGGSESLLNLVRLPGQLASLRSATGDFQRLVPGEVIWPAAPGYERSNCSAMIWPTVFNLCPTNNAKDADNDISQNVQRDLMARFSGTARSWMKFYRFRLYLQGVIVKVLVDQTAHFSRSTPSVDCATSITQRLEGADHAGNSRALA